MADKTPRAAGSDDAFGQGPQRAAEPDAPQQGQAASGGVESRESAPENVPIKDALGNEPQRAAPESMLADKTPVREFGTDERTGLAITAAASEGAEAGAYGMALPAQGEFMGGNIKVTLEPPPTNTLAQHPLTKEQAAMRSPVYQKLAGFVARPLIDWGLIGPGETIRGHMLLLDLNTGQKVRAMDGHRVQEGQLYANCRQLPESLVVGDTIERVLG
jgi:hypothetical protein